MATNDITQAQTMGINNATIPNFNIGTETSDGVESQTGKNRWTNQDFPTHYSYYLNTFVQKPINAFATWVTGKGYTTKSEEDKVILGGIRGYGKDTFDSIIWNCLNVEKFHGDSFAEVIRDPNNGDLANLKTLDPSVMTTVTERGIITGYEQRAKRDKGSQVLHTFQPHEIFHLVNDRVLDNIHGVAVPDVAAWVIDAREEAMRDWRRISHRSTVRILYVDEDDKTRQAELRTSYKEGIKNGDVLILPVKKEDASFEDLQLPPVESFLAWLRYLDDQIFIAIGVPKSILGGIGDGTESGAKISYTSYEQIYMREIVDLQNDIQNQLGIEIEFNRPASLMSELQAQQQKNPNEQTGFQPNDAIAGRGE